METQREQRLKDIIKDVDCLLESLTSNVKEMSDLLKSEQAKKDGGKHD